MANKPKIKNYKPPEGVKVFIAMPIGETIYAKTALHLAHAFRTLRCNTALGTHSSCDIVGNRIQLVKLAQENRATHIMFIDHDMAFPPGDVNPIERLLSHDKDIIGAWYNFRTRGIDAPPVGTPLTEMSKSETDIFRCKIIGTGFMLINMKVFEKFDETKTNYFQFGRRGDGSLAWGEDAYFCLEAEKLGFEVWADPLVKIGHLGEHQY